MKSIGSCNENFINMATVSLADDAKHAEVTSSNEANPKNVTQEEFDEHVTNFFLNCSIPLKLIEDCSFRNMFKASNMNLMNKDTLENRIDDLYNKTIKNINAHIKKADKICLKTLNYFVMEEQKQKNDSVHYVSTICYLIDEDLKRQSFIISCRPFNGNVHHWYWAKKDIDLEALACVNDFNQFNAEKPINCIHDAGNIEQVVHKMILSASICNNNRIKNMKVENRPVQPLYDLMSLADPLEIETEVLLIPLMGILRKCFILWVSIICYEHENILQDDLKINPPSSTVIEDIHNEEIDTYLFKLHEHLQQIMSIRLNINNLYDCLKIDIENRLQDDDFNIINDYLKSTRPLMECLRMLENDTDGFYGLLLPCLLSLQKKLLTLLTEQNNTFLVLISGLKTYIDVVFSEFFDILTEEAMSAAIATTSYPKFKDKWLRIMDDNWYDAVHAAFLNAIENELREESKIKRHSFFEFDMEKQDKLGFVNKLKARALLKKYLEDNDSDVTMLHRHKEIKKIFLKYNTSLIENKITLELDKVLTEQTHCLDDEENFRKIFLIKLNQ